MRASRILLLAIIVLSPFLFGARGSRGDGPVVGVRIGLPAQFEIQGSKLVLETAERTWSLPARVALRLERDRVWVGSRDLSIPFRIRSAARDRYPRMRVHKREYEGTFDFYPVEGKSKWRSVNRLRMERYLLGVLPHEMGAKFPLRALQAQAVASRTYAYYHWRSRGSQSRYHLNDDTTAQVYRGAGKIEPRIVKAVDTTRGKVLTFEGRVFESYYHSTCGGTTASARAMLGGLDIEPLRSSPCGHCTESKFYRWESTIPAGLIREALAKLTASHGIPIGKLQAIVGVEREPGGHASYVRIEHDRGRFEVDAIRFRERVVALGGKKLRSTAFACQREGGNFVFRGSGWGHGAGMCQMGATGLANAGMSWSKILARYYQGSRLTPAWR